MPAVRSGKDKTHQGSSLQLFTSVEGVAVFEQPHIVCIQTCEVKINNEQDLSVARGLQWQFAKRLHSSSRGLADWSTYIKMYRFKLTLLFQAWPKGGIVAKLRRHTLGDLVDEASGNIQLSKGKLVVISVVEDIQEVGVKWMYVVHFGEFI